MKVWALVFAVAVSAGAQTTGPLAPRDVPPKRLPVPDDASPQMQLRQARVEAQQEVLKGQSHAQYARDDRMPGTREAFGETVAFFDKHLGH